MTDAQLEDIIARGVPGTPMPAFAQAAGGDLTAAQVRILAEGLRTTWRTAPASGPLPRYRADDAAGDPARGREVFQSYCARCHGDDGAGGARGGSVVDEAFLSLTSDQALRTTIIAGRSDLGTPGWKDYAPGAAIDDQQISDVVAWLTSHRGHHDVQHACFFGGALLFWWPVVGVWPSRPMWPRWSIIPYLVSADLINTAQSAILSFSSSLLYPSYAHVIRPEGFTALNDQMLAGVIMWVPGSIAFLLPAIALTVQLFERTQTAPPGVRLTAVASGSS